MVATETRRTRRCCYELTTKSSKRLSEKKRGSIFESRRDGICVETKTLVPPFRDLRRSGMLRAGTPERQETYRPYGTLRGMVVVLSTTHLPSLRDS